MNYEVRIVDDNQLAAEWVLVGRDGTFVLFLRQAFDTPGVHAQARALMRSLAAA